MWQRFFAQLQGDIHSAFVAPIGHSMPFPIGSGRFARSLHLLADHANHYADPSPLT